MNTYNPSEKFQMRDISVAYRLALACPQAACPESLGTHGMGTACRDHPLHALSVFLHIADFIVVTTLLLFDLLTPKRKTARPPPDWMATGPLMLLNLLG